MLKQKQKKIKIINSIKTIITFVTEIAFAIISVFNRKKNHILKIKQN